MFDSSVAALRSDLRGLVGAALDGLDDATLVDRIAALEELKSAACAAQARLTVALDTSVRTAAAARGVPSSLQGRGVAAQVGLARRESPVKAARLVGLAKVLVDELPATLAALAAGETSEWRATLVTRETATLDLADRKAVDADLGPRLGTLGDRASGDEARKLDPAQLVKRVARAEADRTVTIRPAPDCMAYLTALVPVAHGVAAFAAVTKQAEALRAAGDDRCLGQLKADTFLTRLTGQSETTDKPVEPAVVVSLVVSDRTLLGGDHEPAHLAGFGPVPGFLARRVVTRAQKAWVRRLYATTAGDLVDVDARTRLFPRAMRAALVARDQWCRTPWCNAPIRHADHITRHADDGDTTLTNGQGLCARCNQTKEAVGWHHRPDTTRDGRHQVVITTPTGHTHTTTVIPLPRGPDGLSTGELYLSDVLLTYEPP